MKALITVVIVIAGIIVAGCDPFTTRVSLTENTEEQIEERILEFEKESATGAEITVLFGSGQKLTGELLSVRDSTIIVCEKISATETELANKKYTISSIRINDIKELNIEGNMYPLWIGAGISLVVFTTAYLIVKDDINLNNKPTDEESIDETIESCCTLGALAGLTAIPAIIGKGLSTDNVLLTEIPTDYKFLPLKSLARYGDEEPDYLRKIK